MIFTYLMGKQLCEIPAAFVTSPKWVIWICRDIAIPVEISLHRRKPAPIWIRVHPVVPGFLQYSFQQLYHFPSFFAVARRTKIHSHARFQYQNSRILVSHGEQKIIFMHNYQKSKILLSPALSMETIENFMDSAKHP